MNDSVGDVEKQEEQEQQIWINNDSWWRLSHVQHVQRTCVCLWGPAWRSLWAVACLKGPSGQVSGVRTGPVCDVYPCIFSLFPSDQWNSHHQHMSKWWSRSIAQIQKYPERHWFTLEDLLYFLFFIFKDFIYLFLGRGGGKEKERERNISV